MHSSKKAENAVGEKWETCRNLDPQVFATLCLLGASWGRRSWHSLCCGAETQAPHPTWPRTGGLPARAAVGLEGDSGKCSAASSVSFLPGDYFIHSQMFEFELDNVLFTFSTFQVYSDVLSLV